VSTTVRARSWDGDPPHADAARARLLDATRDCIAQGGLRAVSVAGVAAAAGVSRPTVYRYFADRDELVGASLHQAAETLRAEIRSHISHLDSAADMLVEALVLARRQIPGDPVLRAIWDSSAVDPTVIEQFTGPVGITWARQCLSPAIEAAGWPDAATEEAMEVLLRLLLSMLVSPAPRRTDDEFRSFIQRRVLPGLGDMQ
jgi:AcrR family transcriptional regulator